MKSRRFVRSGILICTLFISNAGLVPLGAAEISFFVGDTTLLRGGKAIPVETGMKLQSGDVIHTGGGSETQVLFDDGSVVRLKEMTTVRIGSSGIEGSSDVAVSRGSVSAKFAKIKKGEKKVYGPTVICAVRGTEFNLTVSKNGDSRVDLSEGSVENRNPYGSRMLKSGTSSETSVGKEPVPAGESTDLWREKTEHELKENPGNIADSFRKYVRTFDSRNSETSVSMKKLSARAGSVRKETATGTGDEISQAETRIVEDYVLNETAGDALDGIIHDFSESKKDIYDTFLAVKEESNRVRELQKQNYEAIRAIRDEYLKNYEMIKGIHKKETERIKESLKDTDTRPKFPEK